MKRSITPSAKSSGQHKGVPASGRFLLRLPPALHDGLRRAAMAAGVSLNEHCVRLLAGGGAPVDPDAAALLERLERAWGADLVGVVAYGSWARGEAGDASDIDLLVVVDTRLEITRESYRTLDEPPPRWGGRDVDVHLVTLPATGAEITGSWAEAATEGIVLRERGLEISRRLIDIRRRVAAGEITCRVVHGQPYWVRGG